ncbi:MAG: WbqC family protein [Candidatus Thermoplasmatota archaeon]|nr:WbqC family protein [Candidatus Thermoplasmatota archaeon]
MIVGIHQPNYLPYLGFFDKLKKSDIFIIYDDAQFNKADFQHRNRIRIYHGSKWLTVPVEKKPLNINRIAIKNDVTLKGGSWNEVHFNEIRNNYSNTLYYKDYESELLDIYSQKYDYLVDLNLDLINFFSKAFNIKTKTILSSEFNFNSKSTEKIIDLVNAVDGDTYLSGIGGKSYLNSSNFQKAGINILFQQFEHPKYVQQYKGFIPNMSSIDVLLNVGKCPL